MRRQMVYSETRPKCNFILLKSKRSDSIDFDANHFHFMALRAFAHLRDAVIDCSSLLHFAILIAHNKNAPKTAISFRP